MNMSLDLLVSNQILNDVCELSVQLLDMVLYVWEVICYYDSWEVYTKHTSWQGNPLYQDRSQQLYAGRFEVVGLEPQWESYAVWKSTHPFYLKETYHSSRYHYW